VRQVLSKNLKLSRQYLSNIVNQKAGISADISMHLSKWALDKVSEKEAFRATDLMNNRPRKRLGYKTPFEVFAQ
jgi:hypothetical protein